MGNADEAGLGLQIGQGRPETLGHLGRGGGLAFHRDPLVTLFQHQIDFGAV